MSSPSTQFSRQRTLKTHSNLSHIFRRRSLTWVMPCMLLSSIILSACGLNVDTRPRHSRVYEAWDVINQPTRFGRQFETRYENLPKSGQINTIPWSDYYWPTQRAGIAYRWQNPASPPFGYNPPSRQTIMSMNSDQLAKLSPAEKIDIFMNRFDFPTVAYERRRTYPGAAAWEGLCHGWAPAALEFQEPGPVTVEGPNGLRVPFGASDIKALLTWHMAVHNTLTAVGLGGRCNLGGSVGMSTSSCRDSNAGAFHIVLSNMIGRYREGFIMDMARAAEVWNQPIYAFRSREIARQAPSPGAAPGTRQEVVIESEVNYSVEVQPHWNLTENIPERPAVGTIVYRYRLELDSQGQIRGGEWLQDARPDFIWLQKHGSFVNEYRAIQRVYEAAIR